MFSIAMLGLIKLTNVYNEVFLAARISSISLVYVI